MQQIVTIAPTILLSHINLRHPRRASEDVSSVIVKNCAEFHRYAAPAATTTIAQPPTHATTAIAAIYMRLENHMVVRALAFSGFT